MELALALLLVGGGGITVWSGFTDQSIVGALKTVLSGNKGTSSGSASSSSSGRSSSGGTGNSGLAPLLTTPVTGAPAGSAPQPSASNPDPLIAPYSYGSWFDPYVYGGSSGGARGGAGTAASPPPLTLGGILSAPSVPTRPAR